MKPMTCMAIAAFASEFCIADAALADDDDYPSWRPNSTTATSITGPIVVQSTRLHAVNTDFPLHLDGTVAAFKPDQGSIPARIYAVTSTTNPNSSTATSCAATRRRHGLWWCLSPQWALRLTLSPAQTSQPARLHPACARRSPMSAEV